MTAADALALVVRTAAAVSWPVHEGARLAVRMVVQTRPELRTPALDAVPMPCAETMLAIDALESAETLVADLRAAYMAPEHAPVTRAERIEAAARALVCAGDAMVAAQGRFDGIGAERARAECVAAHGRLRAALCSCTAHGPDLACVEHGEALRAWQKRHAP